MMSCKKASYLMSQQLDRKLSIREAMALKFHMLRCGACASLKDNMALLRKACERLHDGSR
jgi:transcription initiation factor IIE alpha subunit